MAAKNASEGKAQLIRDLREGSVGSLYLISGEETYMKEHYLSELEASGR
ncbi:hypothetical protein RWV98_10100 [Agathobaculum sp. NTUH-O15-33]|nr:hypothetical protein [Agathobaculum sp. NTUH-O15-33]WNX86590.1 hypothetical protein RWV98_10100 [Agathobaculum sp. NTUH-O15-33]